MKKIKTAAFIPFIILILCSFSYKGSAYLVSSDTVAYDVSLKAYDTRTKQPVQGVKLVLIDRDGEAADILKTDKNGDADKRITVSLDKRYYSPDKTSSIERGTVTVIAYRDGYCETVLYEVPVSYNKALFWIPMNPSAARQKNEPYVTMGFSNHVETDILINKYRKL